jgi:hypothetical protein
VTGCRPERHDRIDELVAAQHLYSWAVDVVGAITTASKVLPVMATVGRGSFIITGGMPQPVPGAVPSPADGTPKLGRPRGAAGGASSG